MLEILHIDVGVYQSAKDVLHFVWPRIEFGGVVVFDDYGFETCSGIPTLIAELLTDTDNLVIKNLNGHAIIIKTA
ncbi:MAG: TylF/MycF/NovP-related O-methyltransferase [Terracidiphilus sp.]